MNPWAAPGNADEWIAPGYAEERELGRGTSGRVIAAVRETDGQRVAIKYLGRKLVRDSKFLAGFRAEAQLLRSLVFAHVVQLFDYVEQPGEGAAIVMELVNGVSLREMISRQGAASPESALAVLKGSLLGLAAAHGLGIVHRDYKPENVLIDDEGTSKLSDFGVAIREGRRAPAAGTPLYMAPEQWEGAPASRASDIYAATAVFFECLTGKAPFSGRLGQLKKQHLTAAVPVDQVAEPLRGLIARGMAKNPGDRPVNAMAFAAELEDTAAAAYGPAWEERGRSQLRERAAALLSSLPGARARRGAGGAAAASWFDSHRRVVLAGSAAAAAVVVGVAAVAVAGAGNHSETSQQAAAINGPGSGPASTAPGRGKPARVKVTPGADGKATFQAAVTVMPPAVTSSCATPTTFAYTGDLTASTAGSVSYQWVYSSGKSGPVQTLHFSGPGTMQVTGGTVATKAAGTGWAAIQLVSPAGGTSNKATYTLDCSATPAAVTASASVTPATDTVGCYSAPPHLTFTGHISDSKAGKVTYHWELPAGNGPTETLDFTKAGSLPVASATVTAPSDSATGSGIIVITSPTAASSNAAKFSVTCAQPAITVPITSSPASPDTVTCGSAPPVFTLTGSITSNQTISGVTYHWVRPNGSASSPATITLTAGVPKTVTDKFTPPSDSFSGSETLDITAPFTASQSLPLSVSCTYQALSVTGSLPAGTVGTAYSATVSASGGKAPYTWTASGLPSGLAIGTSTGVISGTPSTAGTFAVTVTASDSQSPAKTASAHFTVVVSAPKLQITTGSLPGGTAGTGYPSTTLAATGGDGHYTWSASGLPAGLSLSSGGVLSGTPTAAGTFAVTVTVKDGESPAMTASATYSVIIAPAPSPPSSSPPSSAPPSPSSAPPSSPSSSSPSSAPPPSPSPSPPSPSPT